MIAADLRRLTRRAHLGERHIDAALGEIHRQSEADRTTPDDQDLGIDPPGHGRIWLSERSQACVYFREHLKLWVLEGWASSQIAQPLAVKRTNLHSEVVPWHVRMYTGALIHSRVEACHERLARRSQRTTGSGIVIGDSDLLPRHAVFRTRDLDRGASGTCAAFLPSTASTICRASGTSNFDTAKPS